MEYDSQQPQNQSNIHFNPKHLISSTVHINPKVLKNRTIHINPNTFKGVRPNSVHLNPKLIGNFNLNNLEISQCKTQKPISLNNNLLIDNKSSKIDSQLVTVTNQSTMDPNYFFQNPKLYQSNDDNVIPNIQLAQDNSSKEINLESTKQCKYLSYRPPQILTLKNESNPLISLSKTKLIRKENTIIKHVLPLSKNNNEPILPLISLSKMKLVRKQFSPNPKRTSISKKSQSNSLVSLSKTKLVRKNSNPISDSNQEKTKVLKYLNKPILNTSFISVSRNKLIRKTETPKKIKISRKSSGSRKSLSNKSSSSKSTISKYRLIRTSTKKASLSNSKSKNSFKLDNRKILSNHQELKRDSRIRKYSQTELNKNTTLLKARAVVRNARKLASYPKTEGLVWMRNGAKLLPVCRYFLAGCCVKDSCPYLHVKHSIKAPICLAFLRGQCAQEEKCIRRHIFICPRWDRYGSCTVGKKCPWPHTRRKSSKNQSKNEEKKFKKHLRSKSQNNKSDNKKYKKDIKENVEEKQEKKRYYEQECKIKNENIVINEEPNDSQIEPSVVDNDSETESNHIVSKRPKIGILPAFIPLS